MALPQTLHSTKILKVLPFISALFVVIGVTWLFMLPLDEYSRKTYISENALLPGGVHTYFSGSEHNVFRAYRHEVHDLGRDAAPSDVVQKLGDIFRSHGLKVGTQKYSYWAAGKEYTGENVYAVLEAPRGDATEAIVMCAAWLNMDEVLNESGVALVLALARYFKRWSLWSKDVIFLITSDSRAGPQAWVDAYHELHSPPAVASLPVKSGAIQGAVVIDYPTSNPWESMHLVYDGVNGQLPNLDLFNTAIHIAGNQMGVRGGLQEMWDHRDNYEDRLRTMLRGMVNQGLGHATGPHSSFIPYHIDAVTLQVAGTGSHDDVTMGRILESLFRSLNNLLEHFHQSFFFYLLLAPKRFVSIGTYLPSAMLIAANFTFTAIGLWIKSGKKTPDNDDTEPSDEEPTNEDITNEKSSLLSDADEPTSQNTSTTIELPITEDSQRDMFLPIAFVLFIHLLGFIPLYVFNNTPSAHVSTIFYGFSALNLILPLILSYTLSLLRPSTSNYQLITCVSLLLLGLFLSALATLNFSLSFLIGVFSIPYSFARPMPSRKWLSLVLSTLLQIVGPTTALVGVAVYWKEDVALILGEAAFGWSVWGMWTQVVVWCVWWPAWILAGVAVASTWFVEPEAEVVQESTPLEAKS
ncbi:Gaa1-like protein [Geopyxis carbonaria]|nr:Gaa1-like protein [Geopyxis carbonaria]